MSRWRHVAQLGALLGQQRPHRLAEQVERPSRLGRQVVTHLPSQPHPDALRGGDPVELLVHRATRSSDLRRHCPQRVTELAEHVPLEQLALARPSAARGRGPRRATSRAASVDDVEVTRRRRDATRDEDAAASCECRGSCTAAGAALQGRGPPGARRCGCVRGRRRPRGPPAAPAARGPTARPGRSARRRVAVPRGGRSPRRPAARHSGRPGTSSSAARRSRTASSSGRAAATACVRGACRLAQGAGTRRSARHDGGGAGRGARPARARGRAGR